MGYGKYPHEGKLRECEFTMVIHHRKECNSDIIEMPFIFIFFLFWYYCAPSIKGVVRQ
jgi:hypothetical protein